MPTALPFDCARASMGSSASDSDGRALIDSSTLPAMTTRTAAPTAMPQTAAFLLFMNSPSGDIIAMFPKVL
ncbi:MAG TPA: hypothetical protein DIT84_04760 [Clostridiales bacterium]|nr:hypothetical protein [Clostridiales bacterium]